VVLELLVENKGIWAPEEVRIVGFGEILPGAILFGVTSKGFDPRRL